MKVLAIVALCFACVAGAPNGYGATLVRSSGYSAPALLRTDSYGGYGAAVVRSHVPIVRYHKTDDGYGTYQMDVQTGDGISQVENGHLKSVSGPDSQGPVNVKDGSYSWTSPEGQFFTVNYVADENGFRASGDHLPTPPPIPAEILKSLSLPRVHDSYSSGYSSGYAAPALRVASAYEPTVLIRSNKY